MSRSDSDAAIATNDATRIRLKDNEFYMTFVTFEVQNLLFRVPVEAFEARSDVFRDMFSLMVENESEDENEIAKEGKSDDAPIVLEGIEVEDFRALLRFLYPKKHGSNAEFSQKEWIGIHALAHMWGFEEAKEASKAFLVDMEDSITKFELAIHYSYDDLLRLAYKELANRHTSLSTEEAKRIGFEPVSHVSRLRDVRFEARWRHQVLHTKARSYATRKGKQSFRCPHCAGLVQLHGHTLDAGVENLTYECDSCGVIFHGEKKIVDLIVDWLLDSEIKAIVPEKSDVASIASSCLTSQELRGAKDDENIPGLMIVTSQNSNDDAPGDHFLTPSPWSNIVAWD